ncbi:hypothetical protein VTK73DRAFT_3086 [Phialemonium thermophilum]|uniref:Fumarylacetoacetase n=1 Tax=Phialemonium thermophilum TaxID=223376 RepID=A0ABR3VL52_9PEZI
MAASWVPSVDANSDFSLANIPFGIVTTAANPIPRAATAIGSYVLDLAAVSQHPDFPKLFPSLEGHRDVFAQPSLNAFAALGRPVHRERRS